MGYLYGARGYLAGPIECADPTIDWRSEPKRVLIHDFGINLFDPYTDPKQQWFSKLSKAKEAEEYDAVTMISKKFVRKDLSIVDRADLVIAYLRRNIPTTGTVHEIINSNNAKKPTLLVCPDGKKYIPSWYFGFIPHKNMFNSWNDLYDYLKDVDCGKYMDDDKWSYVYKII